MPAGQLGGGLTGWSAVWLAALPAQPAGWLGGWPARPPASWLAGKLAVNRCIERGIYYFRHCDAVKVLLIGSVYLSGFDGLKGFNLQSVEDHSVLDRGLGRPFQDRVSLVPQAWHLDGGGRSIFST